MYEYEWPRPMMTSDMILFRLPYVMDFDDPESTFEVLMVKRKNEPFKNQWALPGGYVNVGESVLDAAKRECFEETGIEIHEDLNVTMLPKLFDRPERDPRGWTISAAYMAVTHDYDLTPVASDDALESKFITMTFKQLDVHGSNFAFDHRGVLLCAFLEISSRIKLKLLLGRASLLSDRRMLARPNK